MQATIEINVLLFDDDADEVLVQIGRRLAETRIADRSSRPPWIAHIGDEIVQVNGRGISNPREAETAFAPGGSALDSADVVLLDNDWVSAQRGTTFGLELLRQARWKRGRGPLLAIYTAAHTFQPDFVTEALQLGADALINKNEPTHFLNLLIASIERKKRRIEEGRWRRLGAVLSEKDPALASESPAMQQLLQDAALLAPWRKEIVLILGEVGTGKSLLAKAIHACSPRANQPMITLDPGHVSDSLLHAELFGVERGAFTDARPRKGILETAEGSTLFVDELQNMTLPMQEALLRVIQDGHYVRPGDPRERDLDVRFFFATNADPAELIRSGKLRTDFFSRIDQSQVRMPPLRERLEDIPRLARRFIDEFHAENFPDADRPILEDDAIELLQASQWPDNIRGLRNTIRRSLVRMPPGAPLSAKDLVFNQQPDLVTRLPKQDLGTLLELAPRAGNSQRTIFDRLVEKAPEPVLTEELNRALQQPATETASEALMVAVSRLRPRLKQHGFDILQERDLKAYMIVKYTDHV